MKPLAASRYQFGEWETARVNIDYHIEVLGDHPKPAIEDHFKTGQR
jgi:hypothetical protein